MIRLIHHTFLLDLFFNFTCIIPIIHFSIFTINDLGNHSIFHISVNLNSKNYHLSHINSNFLIIKSNVVNFAQEIRIQNKICYIFVRGVNDLGSDPIFSTATSFVRHFPDSLEIDDH